MISEAIGKIIELSGVPHEGRRAVVEVGDGSDRLFLYSDAERKYSPIPRVVIQGGSVSNVESFSALVIEEGVRRKGADHACHTGEFMTAIFNANGAVFSADDRERLDVFMYERALSPQWQIIGGALGKPLEHKEFVRLLQRLRPSILGYEEIIRQFRKIAFTDKTGITSEPLLEAGRNSNEYRVALEVKAGGPTSETTLPSEFEVALQYARGSESKYTMKVEVDLTTIPKGERRELRFTAVAPDIENVIEQAVFDEVAFFRDRTKAMTRLLVLVDF